MPIMKPHSNPVLMLDCTLRDGGYYNHWDFPPSLIRDYLSAMSELAIDVVEIGFRSFDRHGFKGGAAYSTDAWIRSLNVPPGLKIGVMINASELIMQPGGIQAALGNLFVAAAKSPVSLVRIACHIDEYAAALPGCTWLREQGYQVGLNLMQIADSTPAEIEAISQKCAGQPIDVLYFADSLGSLNPERTAAIVKSLRKHWMGAIGIHTHDNMGQALANSMRAVEAGTTWVDSTVSGMGRGPGNVKTEYLAIALDDRRPASSNITPLLTLARQYFAPLQATHGWGSNPYYYLAGRYGIHPTYIQEMLSDSRYAEADILAVIDHFRVTGARQFSAGSLEAARHFYTGEARGTWHPSAIMAGREVLILGPGPGLAAHKDAVEAYVRCKSPYVIALNTQMAITAGLIDARAACHPIRLLADCAELVRLPQPLITPASMLPQSVIEALTGKSLLDFGLAIRENTFEFFDTHCVLPTSLVIAYAMAAATSGQASRLLLAGFDGYGPNDPRTAEMDAMLEIYQKSSGALPLQSITPTHYKMPSTSVYALIA